jgi:hypothetical protein
MANESSHPPDEIHDQMFTGETITIDGLAFFGCKFTNCTFVFNATKPPLFSGCTFVGGTFNLANTAAITATFLAMLVDQGYPEFTDFILSSFSMRGAASRQ